MTRPAILEQFDRLNVGSRGDQRAPHKKPLLVFLALSRWSRGERADIPFRDAEPALTSLLKVTRYFFRLNLLGINESRGKAVKIMIAMTVMGVVLLLWCGVTLLVRGPSNAVPLLPDFHQSPDPLGFVGSTRFGDAVRSVSSANWPSLIGVLGLFIAFGHSMRIVSGFTPLCRVFGRPERSGSQGAPVASAFG